MTEIKNIETLHAEISRLKSDVSHKEQQVKEHFTALKESVKPANLLASFFRKTPDETGTKQENSFMRGAIKTGVSLAIGKFLLSPGEKGDKHISDLVDAAFNKIHGYIDRIRKKKKENRHYKFDDEYDSESN